MARRKTLAEELAELATPQPTAEADFEADELAEGPILDDIDFDLEQEQQPTRKAKEKKARLRADIDLQGAAYSGKRTSRAAAFGAASSSGESAVDSEADAHSTDAEVNSEAAEGGDGGASSSADGSSDSGSEAGTSHDSDDDNDNGSGLDANQSPVAGNHQEDEAAELERQYAEAAAQDQIALADMKDRTSRERTKGLAVLHQKQLWDQNLQMRILLQRCLQAANRLPCGSTHTWALGQDPILAESYAGLIGSASETIDELLTLHTALVEQHPAAQEVVLAGTVASGKRNREEEEQDGEEEVSVLKWRRIDEEYRKLILFRDASVDRWHRKTMLISGAGAAKGNLRALNQSVSSQVALLMKNPTKLARRSGVSAEQRPRVLCQPAKPMAQPVSPTGRHSATAGASTSPVGEEEEQDLEAFDDGEFYAQLLKEFLDSSGGAAGSAFHPQGKKKRKQVDRRASKGRKLRYHIQDKLVNFMAPVEQPGHDIATQLFGSLFGGSQHK
ncbi:hypothetical protein ABBQ38_012331 [Trebouxia sp. C0009 RCD-2024]